MVYLPREYRTTKNKAIRSGPPVPKVKTVSIFQRTFQLARTEEQGIKGHNARGCK